MAAFKQVLRFLDLKEPLRSEILSAHFGEDVFVGPKTSLLPFDVGRLYVLRAAFAWVTFQDKDCWKNFAEWLSGRLPELYANYNDCVGNQGFTDVAIAVTNGRYLSYSKDATSEDSCLDAVVDLTNGEECDADPSQHIYVTVVINLVSTMARGSYEFEQFCTRDTNQPEEHPATR